MKFSITLIIVSFALIVLFSCGGPSVATNQPPVFVSSSPQNGQTDVSLDITLSWTFTDPENDFLTYELFFGDSENNTQSKYKGTENSYRISLEPSKTYYWKIVASDGKNKVQSPLLSFSTVKVNRQPSKPELISPAPTSKNVDCSQVVFQWRCTDPDQDPLRFEIYIDDSFVATVTNYQYTKYNLTAGKTYKWFVKAFDGMYIVESDPATFTTAQIGQNRAPNVPQLVSPPDGAQSVNIPLKLEWKCSDPDNDQLTYEVYINNLKKTTNEPSLLLDDLSPNTYYSWYVKASDGTNTTQGPVWNFRTKGIPNTAPSTPTNPVPENNTSIFEKDVVLSWECSDADGDTLFYDLYFGESSNPPLIRQNLSSSNMLIQNLETNKRYYWKVVAKDGNTSTEGPVWSFYTGVQTSFSEILALADGIYDVSFAQPVTVTKISSVTGNDFFYRDESIFVIGDEFSIIKDTTVATSSFSGKAIWVDSLIPIQRIVAGEIFACILSDTDLSILRISDQNVYEESSISMNQPSSLFVLGQYIYVCDADGLKKIDAIDPKNPILKSTYQCTAKEAFVVDNTVYLLTDSEIVKLSSTDLSEINSTDFSGAKKIYFDSGFVYVLSDQKLTKFDENLSKLIEIDLNSANSLLVSGSYVYVGMQNGIKVFDTNLSLVKSVSINGLKKIILRR